MDFTFSKRLGEFNWLAGNILSTWSAFTRLWRTSLRSPLRCERRLVPEAGIEPATKGL
jgi:hypothetical protein